jgi:hypothetical protein
MDRDEFGWETGPYQNPEKYGLESVGTVDWGGNYEFDMIVVWKRLEDGALLWAQDAGCSCSAPFEAHSLTDGIEPIVDLATFHAMLLEKNAGTITRKYDPLDEGAAIVDLVTKLHGLGLR